MEQKNDTLGVEDVFMLLETLKSNGTFDEIRKQCITDIYAKLTYQNWKQLIELNVNKFLSKVKFTPELNKNTVRERLRKHLLYGCETQDIEEGADRLLTQVLAPHSLSIFEHKIAVAVDEYLGIKNKAPPIELINGLKESSLNLIKASKIEMSDVHNPKIDADNMVYARTLKGDRKNLRSGKKEKFSSLCKESKSLKGNQSEDTNCAGESSKQKSSQYKTSTSDKSKSSSSNHKSSKKDKSCKEVVEKSKNIAEKYKDNINKPKDIVDKSKEKSFLSMNSNSSTRKSNRIDTKRTKHSLEEKNKSSSLCKEPKLLNGKQNDDKSNSGVSSRQKSTIHKNKSSSSDKTKSSSSNHKSSGRDDNTTDVVDRSKGKSLSKNSSSTDIINKSEDESLSMFSDRTVDKSKDKYLSKNMSGTDVDKSKDKSLSKNSTSSDIDKYEKRSLSKNFSSTDITDKYKIKSSLIKNTRYTGVVEKSKDKSLSKDSSSSSHKSYHTDTKRLKLSPVEKIKSPTNKVSDEERKPEKPKKSELNDFQNSIHSNNNIDVIMKDSASTLSNQILHEEIENNGAKVLDNDKSLYTFKGFSKADAVPCKNYQLLKNVIKTLQVQMNRPDKIDNGFKGFTSAETNPKKHRNIIYAELIKKEESKSSTGFIGFSKEDTAMSIGHKHVVKLLELSKKRNNVNNYQQNVKCVRNGIQNGKPFNKVMAAHLYKSNNNNGAKLKKNYSPPINDTKSPTVNNNNHNHDNWIVEQTIKYKLLPVKVNLERVTNDSNNANRDSPQDQKEEYLLNGYDQPTKI